MSAAMLSNVLFVIGACCFLVGTVINMVVLWMNGG